MICSLTPLGMAMARAKWGHLHTCIDIFDFDWRRRFWYIYRCSMFRYSYRCLYISMFSFQHTSYQVYLYFHMYQGFDVYRDSKCIDISMHVRISMYVYIFRYCNTYFDTCCRYIRHSSVDVPVNVMSVLCWYYSSSLCRHLDTSLLRYVQQYFVTPKSRYSCSDADSCYINRPYVPHVYLKSSTKLAGNVRNVLGFILGCLRIFCLCWVSCKLFPLCEQQPQPTEHEFSVRKPCDQNDVFDLKYAWVW